MFSNDPGSRGFYGGEKSGLGRFRIADSGEAGLFDMPGEYEF
jgi:hypothetical protein